MHNTVLSETFLILGLSLGALWVCHRLKVPSILGFLLTGALAGPFALGLIRSVEEVDVLAEIGVVLLLFTIGIQFPLSTLLRRVRTLLVGGGGQVAVTAALSSAVALAVGLDPGVSVLLGFVVALSSTAVVLSSLQREGTLDTTSGRATLGILIFQDLAVVPMMAVIPLLAFDEGGGGRVALSVARAAVALVVVILGARRLIPWVLARVVATRSSELFLLSVVTICLAIAWAASLSGLSLALGAFLAGLLVSESEYSHQALGVVIPLRDVFTAFFFVSIGMMFDPGLVLGSPVAVGLTAGGVLVGKAVIAGGVALALGLPLGAALLVGLSLAQIGEFSFVLARAGVQAGVLETDTYRWVLTVAVLTMASTPVLVALGPRLARAAEALPLPGWLRARTPAGVGALEPPSETPGQVLIVGWGVTGRLVARACAIAGIPYRGVEMNPETVRELTDQGEPVLWGDAAMEPVLERAGVRVSRAVVVAISDASGTRRVAGTVHRLNPGAGLVVRTRLPDEIDELVRLGADDVVAQEWEAAVRIVDRLLNTLLIPRHEAEAFLSSLRSAGYGALREERPGWDELPEKLGGAEIATLEVRPGSALAGRSLAETALRRLHGVAALAIRRNEELLANPSGEDHLEPGDSVVVMGLPEEIAAAATLFRPPPPELPESVAGQAGPDGGVEAGEGA